MTHQSDIHNMDARSLPARPTEKAQKKLRNQAIDSKGHAMYEQTEKDLICRLDKKRRELDKEIAAFKAQKDEEYKLFEKNLKAYCLNIGDLPTDDEEQKIRAEYSAKPTETKATVQTPLSRQKEKEEHPQEKKNGTVGAPSQSIQGLHGAASTIRPASRRAGSPGPSESAKRKRQPHEHERELYGVFTPNYLPLLDSRPHEGHRRSSSELLEAVNLERKEPSTPKRSTAGVLSSSAEYHNQPMSSPPPPPARPLSASVPQGESLGHRRSSSNPGDTMGNRRSSLRNPKEPRSPKRVLFSINDTVVSPSTSPVAQRSNPITSSKTFRLDGGFQKNDSFDIVKGKQDKVSPVERSAMATASLLGTSFSNSSGALGSGISPFRWAYESENRKTSPLVGGDDFEHVDRDDDLFAFDEDLDAVNSRKVNDEDRQSPNSAEEEAVEDVESQKTLVGGSPHAGSLPIEIKWSGRSGNLRGSSP